MFLLISFPYTFTSIHFSVDGTLPAVSCRMKTETQKKTKEAPRDSRVRASVTRKKKNKRERRERETKKRKVAASAALTERVRE